MHLEERSDGLFGEFRVSATDQGNQALELVRDGVLDSFSVGFAPIQHRGSTTSIVERTEVALREASVVAFPAYVGAAIGGVRSQDFDSDELAEFLELAHARGITDLRTLLTEAAAGTSADGAATQHTDEPALATRRIAPHHAALMARKIREELNS
jgi:hypothetical protein